MLPKPLSLFQRRNRSLREFGIGLASVLHRGLIVKHLMYSGTKTGGSSALSMFIRKDLRQSHAVLRTFLQTRLQCGFIASAPEPSVALSPVSGQLECQ